MNIFNEFRNYIKQVEGVEKKPSIDNKEKRLLKLAKKAVKKNKIPKDFNYNHFYIFRLKNLIGEMYKRRIYEMEARDVEARKNLTPEQRKNTPYLDSQKKYFDEIITDKDF